MTTRGALSDIVVLDLTRFLAGPYCTMGLGDMGATVIKVEQKNNGDETRTMGPFINGDFNESGYFKALNRNKKGITLNLQHEQGKRILRELILKADFLIENFRPGVMDRLGFGWDVLQEINPRLIYGAISGFGHTGRYKDRAALDIIGQAMSGVMSVTGWPDREPLRAGIAIGDLVASLSLSTGMLAALHYREKAGIGQKIDISIADSLVSLMTVQNNSYTMAGKLISAAGNRMPDTVYPSDTFKAKNGEYLVMTAANDKFWGKVCEIIKREDLITDERTSKNRLRAQNHELVKKAIEDWTSTKTADEAVTAFIQAGLPAAPIYSVDQVVADPHIALDREMFMEREYPRVGKLKVTGSQYKMSYTKTAFYCPSPDLGEHNQEIYGRLLGYSAEEIARFAADGVI